MASTAILAVAAIAASAIGAGMSYSSSKTAAANTAALAKYNYAIEQQNVANQQAIAIWQAKQSASQMQAQADQLNARGNLAVQTADINATFLEKESVGVEARGREDQRRTREDQLRFTSIQNAKFAKSGVVAAAGTPVEVLAETSRNMQLALSDQWYETNAERTSLLGQADMERYAGQMDAFGYRTDAANARAQGQLARAQGSFAPMAARQQMRQAEINRLSGMNQASGMRSAATAGLVSGVGTLLGSAAGTYGGGYGGKKIPYGGGQY